MLSVLKSYTSLFKVILGVFTFIKETFNPLLYLSIITITASFVMINEQFDVYRYIINNYYRSPLKAVFFFCVDFSAYILCCISVYLFTKQKAFLKDKHFWLISIGMFIFIAIYRSSYFKFLLDSSSMNPELFRYISRSINYFDSIFTIILPMLVFYLFYEKKHLTSFYGLRKKGIDFVPYIWMLLLMSVVIFFASAQSSFLHYYPEVKKTQYIQAAQYLGVSQYLLLGVFEMLYMSAFVVVEIIYRGILIFTMVRFLGPYAVYPMISVYCLLHFGKPLNELISSFLGGFVLGVLAYQSKNIYGGIVIHMGIALLMELFVYIRLLN